jgi:hypothetical protein
MSMAAGGTATPVKRLLAEGISRCCGIYMSMAASGTATAVMRYLD